MDPNDDNGNGGAESRPRILINPPVFIISGVLTLLFVGFAAAGFYLDITARRARLDRFDAATSGGRAFALGFRYDF